jgi:chromate transporter
MGAAFVLLMQPIGISLMSVSIVIITFLTLVFTRIRTPFLILAGILLGLFS